MLARVLLILAALGAVLVIAVAVQPAGFRIVRSATMSASAAIVFAQVNDFHRWRAWSPWEKIDPALRRTYEGAPAGSGAVYRWAGNHEVGEGVMTIIESRPSELMATNTAEFTFKPDGDRTLVTWSMEGRNDFLAKSLHLIMNMDRMIGGNFEKGLAQMKAVAEAAPR